MCFIFCLGHAGYLHEESAARRFPHVHIFVSKNLNKHETIRWNTIWDSTSDQMMFFDVLITVCFKSELSGKYNGCSKSLFFCILFFLFLDCTYLQHAIGWNTFDFPILLFFSCFVLFLLFVFVSCLYQWFSKSKRSNLFVAYK